MSLARTITSLEAVLDLAVWLEKHGRTFYEKAARDTTNTDLRELFESLAAEEGKHCAMYTDLYELYTGKSAEGDELLGEYGKFIQLLIGEISAALDFAGVQSEDELLSRALQFEKNTLLFFNEVRPLFRGKAGTIIEAVCREEKRHIEQLIERRRLLQEQQQADS